MSSLAIRNRVRGAVAKDPLSLGVFDWNDSEDEED